MSRHSLISKLVFGTLVASFLTLETPVRATETVGSQTSPASGAAFTVSGGSVSSLSIAEIETLGLRRVVTTSPWEKGELNFEGVLFRDVLEKLGLDDADAVLVRAADNYTQTVPREDWIGGPLLLATRQDGVPLTRRTQGPTRLVYPLTDQPQYDTPLHKPRWVWMIDSIERVE